MLTTRLLGWRLTGPGRPGALLGICLAVLVAGPAWGEVYVAGPSDYLERLKALQAGDTLALEAGDYRGGLPVHNLVGAPGKRIHIAGPEGRREAVFHGRRGRNVVSIVDSAYVTIRNLRIDGGGKPVDGVKAEGHARFAHHITLRNLTIEDLARDQQIVGISAMCPAWGWVVQHNVIRGAGTGMYFGKPSGTDPFVNGLIEHNLVVDAIGYNLQIKQQDGRPEMPGLPTEPSRTIIRHNVFAKGDSASTGGRARPNVLLGHFPPEGPGASDRYVVYGNLVYRNPSERLFQGEGALALYDNLFVNPDGDGLAIMPHKGEPRRVWLFHNTIVAKGTGLFFRATPATETQLVTANAVFAQRPFSGNFDRSGANATGTYGEAGDRLNAPFAQPGRLDLAPKGDSLQLEANLPAPVLWDLPDAGRDFDGRPRSGQTVGAYASGGSGPRWHPALEIKPRPGPGQAAVRADSGG